MDFGSSLRDVGGGVFRFLYAWILPSAVIVAIYLFVVAPTDVAATVLRSRGTEGVVLNAGALVLATVTISTAVGLLSLPVYRFLEGYTMPRWLARRLRARQVRRRRRLLRQLHASARRPDYDAELLHEKLMLYPESSKDVMPTRLGNGLRAMEMYGYSRYRLDSQELWYELMSVAPAPLRADIEEARAPVDFFISACVHLSLLTTASLVTFAVSPSVRAIVSASIGLALIPVAYGGAVRNVADYGKTVRALTNVGRIPLAGVLGLQVPGNFSDERRMWAALSSVVAWQEQYDPGTSRRLDRYRSQPPQSSPSGSNSSPVTAA